MTKILDYWARVRPWGTDVYSIVECECGTVRGVSEPAECRHGVHHGWALCHGCKERFTWGLDLATALRRKSPAACRMEE